MCVAVCARQIDRRRSTSTSACAPRADGDLAVEHLRLVHDQAGDRRLHVAHLEPGAVVELDDALVGELAAALGVERRAVEHQLDLVALARRRRRRRRRATMPAHRALADDLGVAGELDRAAERVGDLAVGAVASTCWPFLALASALARSRCSVISRRKPSSSTARPCSAAISRVRSIGKP